MGIHAIEKTTKLLMKNVGANEFYSNTSLRRTCMTRLVEAGVPALVIQKKTGRISADLEYVAATETFEKKMSSALYGEHSGYAETTSEISNVVIQGSDESKLTTTNQKPETSGDLESSCQINHKNLSEGSSKNLSNNFVFHYTFTSTDGNKVLNFSLPL